MMAERIDPGSANAGPWIYTTTLQKGGALLDDMRQLVRSWSDAPEAAQRESGVRSNILNKGTRTRLADVYRRAFLPRFVSGPIPKHGNWCVRLRTWERQITSAGQSTIGSPPKRSLSWAISAASSSYPGMRLFVAASARKTF